VLTMLMRSDDKYNHANLFGTFVSDSEYRSAFGLIGVFSSFPQKVHPETSGGGANRFHGPFCKYRLNKFTYLRYRNRDQDPLIFFENHDHSTLAPLSSRVVDSVCL
jgi:hypothetical protein